MTTYVPLGFGPYVIGGTLQNTPLWFPPTPTPTPAPTPIVTPPTTSTPNVTVPNPSASDPVATGVDIKQITQETYGKVIPVSVGGRRRMGGYIIWGPKKTTTTVNGLPQTLWSFGVSFGFSAAPDGTRGVLEIRLDTTVVYSTINNVASPSWLKWRFYPGTETQEPDPLAVAEQGSAANAFRGQMVLFFEDLPAQKIPFVSALICDALQGDSSVNSFGSTGGFFIESTIAADWASGITYTHTGSANSPVVEIFTHRISTGDLISSLPLVTTGFSAFTSLGTQSWIWCPEGQVLLGVGAGGLSSASVAIDPDSAAIIAECVPTDFTGASGGLSQGFNYFPDTSTGSTIIVVAAFTGAPFARIHLSTFNPNTLAFEPLYSSTDNFNGLVFGNSCDVCVQAHLVAGHAAFHFAAGSKLLLATVNVSTGAVVVSIVHSAAATINHICDMPSDGNIVIFLTTGLAYKLSVSGGYTTMWSVSPGFTVPAPVGVGSRKTRPLFMDVDTTLGKYWSLNLTSGDVTSQDVALPANVAGYVYDSETGTVILGILLSSPASSNNTLGSTDTITRSDALVQLAAFFGYTSDEFGVIGVTGDWVAIIIAYDTDFQSLLQLLAGAYGWDIVQSDKLYIVQPPLGASLTLAGTITADDIKLADSSSSPFTTIENEEVEVPQITEIEFIDPSRDYNFNVARYKQPKDPVAVTASVNTDSIKLPIVMDMSAALTLAAGKSFRGRVGKALHTMNGMPSLLKYEPGDVVRIVTPWITIPTAKIYSVDFGSDYSVSITLQSILATGPAFDPDYIIDGDPGTVSPGPLISGGDAGQFTIILDTPLLRIGDDTNHTALRFYWANPVRYMTSTFGNTYVQILYIGFSYDNFASGFVVASPNEISLMGSLTAALAAPTNPFVTDYTHTLTFKPVSGDATTLTALSYTELMNEKQLFAVGKPGRWELIGAGQTCTANANGTYSFTGLLRGRRGSEVFDTHSIGDQVVLIKQNSTFLASIGEGEVPFGGAFTSFFGGFGPGNSNVHDMLGDQLYYSPAILNNWLALVSYSIVLAPQFSWFDYPTKRNVTINGIAETPYAPCHLDAVVAGSDIDLSWERRDRLSFGLDSGEDVTMNETSELYDIEIMSGSTIKRTITDNPTKSYTYLSANITTDFGSIPGTIKFRVYQKSNLIGRGFRAEKTITL